MRLCVSLCVDFTHRQLVISNCAFLFFYILSLNSCLCFLALQEKFKASQKQVNVFTKLPVGSTQAQVLSPQPPQQDGLKAPATLSCSQCTRKITFKPELVQIKVTCVGVQ